jgi:dTDP-4-dehydrorhamnose 3,5-epimerase
VKFAHLKLTGAYIIEPEPLMDERGIFARTYCRKEFEARGLNPNMVQCSTSFNKRRGTLRGLHYRVAAHGEVKLVRCTRGAIYDIVVDLRPESPTFRQWCAIELTADNRTMIYVPEGFAHGFETLEDSSEVFYQMSELHEPAYERGIRWSEAEFKFEWPFEPVVISARDRAYADFVP